MRGDSCPVVGQLRVNNDNDDIWQSISGKHMLYFRLNYALCGLSAWWWHACNVALHAACCALVARAGAVVARLQRPFAALAALLFAVHPVHTEAVLGKIEAGKTFQILAVRIRNGDAKRFVRLHSISTT
ncbi:jg16468 [Pararge aegeria aegeria]|uniref:Jg16468 protein n=1 Tax=Pararge aegeria aegeria TaxID=348720 RepID=A0A8S4RIH8_9NEOP|nr:jg16468 [Pararge aegeria aegeria]